MHLEDDAAPAELAGAVLAEEAKRQQVQAERSADVVLPDDLLPGVDAEPMGLRETLRSGGLAMMVVIVLVTVVEEFNRQTTTVLGPDIQDTFSITDTKLVGLASFGGVALVLGAVPLGWLADRISRRLIVVVSLLVASLGLLLAAASVNTFQLFWAFTLIGFGAAYSNPVYGSLIADQYPIPGRGRAFALYAMATPLGLMIGPFVAGAISDVAGGPEGWRWVYVTIASVLVVLALTASVFLKDPPRGGHEQRLILGELLEGEPAQRELPITIATAYQRLKKIKTFWFVCTGLGVLGFTLITVPLQLGLLLRDGYHYGAYTRGWILSLAQIPAVLAMIAAGFLYDSAFRKNPERIVRQAGIFIVLFGVVLVIGLRFESIVLLMAFYALAGACTSAALVAVGPIVASVSPYRLRAQSFAIVPVFTFLMGGFFGSLLAGALSDAHGQRTALTVVVPLSATIGGLLFFSGARYLKRDISLAVEDLLEEQQEQERMRQTPDDIPVLQVRNLDFSYGPVQVLFDVDLEVRRGEVVALLGTNGAGKSTLLRAISGLGIPDRGVVRLNGQALTYVEAEVRFQVGVVQLRGGAGVFPDLTVVENLRTSVLACSLEPAVVQQKIAKAMDLFPALASRPGVDARELSGGQQQMLALAMALVHEPEVLLIDELSLGLAPTILQELLEVVARLKAEGMTMVIVEQSLNVALAFADRAIFMEKGRVQFEGPAQELLERDDLAKAVFLGGGAGRPVITQQALFYGAISGLTYAVLAAGFVLVYRSTGVLNFAQGEIGAFGVAIIGLLAAGYDIPYWPSFFLAVATSVLISVVVEMTVVRRLASSSRLVLLIATIGLAQLLFAARLLLPDTAAAEPFPLPFDLSWQMTDSILVVSREVMVLIVAPLTILGLALFMTKTRFGLMVRASASNPDTARVFGISTKRTSTIVWAIAGGFAAVTAIMIAPIQGITPGSAVRAGTAAIGPALLVRALVVALIARMRSLPMCLVGGLIVGVFESVVRANVDRNNQSIVELWLFVAALVLVMFWVRGKRDPAAFSLSARVKPIPERLMALWYVRHLTKIGFGVLFGGLALLPLFLTRPSQEFLWTDVLIFAMVALPLSMLLGWAGQFSLGQFAFVGLGAGTMVMVTHDLDIPVPFDLVDLSLQLPWAVAVLVATAVGLGAALLIGLPALRVHGLFLAIITLAFSVAAASWLFDQGAFTGSTFATTTPFMEPPVIAGIDFGDRRSFYFLCLACLGLMTAVMARVRRTGLGRSMIAVNENEDMAAASTISSTRMKLVAFALSGGMAAFAGALFITLRVELNPAETFTTDGSLRMIATAVIGGIGSVAGPIIGALFVRGLPVAFGDVEEVQLLTSAIGLLLLLMYFPGGLMQIIYAARDAVLGWADRRLTIKEVAPVTRPAVPTRASRDIAVPVDAAWLRLDDVRVRFGGIHAVDGVSLEVHPGELVGIIGTNGAGKSTLMNAIGGFVPSTGTIEVLGHDLSGLPAHRRHRVGLGRGFQAARLYPELTVRETIMVALEARERSLVVPSITGLPPSPGRERRKRADAIELIDFVGLGGYAEQFVANLSTGTRRIVELSCLVAADAKLLLLDEPTGGVAQRETEAFAPLILSIREELGAAMVVIEHDMPLIMGISDRVYCLEAGQVIAEGDPSAMREDARVVASYLGTDERAIQRSGVAGS